MAIEVLPEYISEFASEVPAMMDFMVLLKKAEGSFIGLRLSVDGIHLRVTKVREDGLIAHWNHTNPSQQVRTDDRVMEVNGIRGDPLQMLHVCLNSNSLQIVVRCTSEIFQRLSTLPYANLSRDDFEFLCWVDNAVPTSTCVHRRFVAQLPKSAASSRSIMDVCSICLCDWEIEDGVTQLPCKHSFCTWCIMSWLTECAAQCPLCKASVECPELDKLSSFDDSIGCTVVADSPVSASINARSLRPKTLMSRLRYDSNEVLA